MDGLRSQSYKNQNTETKNPRKDSLINYITEIVKNGWWC